MLEFLFKDTIDAKGESEAEVTHKITEIAIVDVQVI